jgi:hypothetical protein
MIFDQLLPRRNAPKRYFSMRLLDAGPCFSHIVGAYLPPAIDEDPQRRFTISPTFSIDCREAIKLSSSP